MISFPGCKVNIGLNVVGKRPDGFHDLESVFYPIAWTDVLEINPSNSDESTLKMFNSSEDFPKEQNIVWKAYKLLEKDFNFPALSINLIKNVPSGAGLGGGSADGSYTLKQLNQLFELQLSQEQLLNYAEKLGSDCPFFIVDKPCYVAGRGEILEPIQLDLSHYFGLLVNPGIHISTQQAFSAITPHPSSKPIKEAISEPIDSWRKNIVNDFEKGVFSLFPEIDSIKNRLYEDGALYASMTGTGSSVFAIFENEPNISSFPGHYAIWRGRL